MMEKEQPEPFDYEKAKQKLKEQFRTGEPLFGKGGVLTPHTHPQTLSFFGGQQ